MNTKRLYTVDERKAMADAGEAMPDGSYPIADEEDLKNAIQAYGRAKDPDATRMHILKRAKSLGKMNLIPEDWDTKGWMPDDGMDPEDETQKPEMAEKGMMSEEDMEGAATEYVEEPETEMAEDAKSMVEVSEDGDVKCAMGKDAKGDCGYDMGAKYCKSCGAMAKIPKNVEMKSDGEKAAAEGSENVLKQRYLDAEQQIAQMLSDTNDKPAKKAMARKRRLASMGKEVKSASGGSYLCGMSREVRSAGTSPCEGCAGGCIGNSEVFGLLEIEGLAEQFGKVLDSGYSPTHDLFLVDVKADNGALWQVAYRGDGEFDGIDPLRPEDLDLDDVISPEDAMKVALDSIEGKALSVEIDVFDGVEIYAVEIEGKDGLLHDVLIAPDGVILGEDTYKVVSEAELNVKTDGEDDEILADLLQFQAMVIEQELAEQGDN